MTQEPFPNTIGAGAREYITGIEHLEALLNEQDDYNMHDSQIPCFHCNYDYKARTLDVEIRVLGSMYECPKDKDIYILFCFEDIISLAIDMTDWCDISSMCLRVENNFLVCEFNCYYMKVWARHLTISPIEMRDSIKD